MDEGYRLLQHVVRQVFGNLGQAARLTVIPLLLPTLLTIIMVYYAVAVFGINLIWFYNDLDIIIPMAIVGVIFWLYFVAWAAVGWHRFILLEEFATGIFPKWHNSLIQTYTGRTIFLVFIMVIIGFVAGFVAGFAMRIVDASWFNFIATVAMNLGFSWFALRIGLILPAAAIGKKMALGESFNATRPVSTDILVPIFVIALVVALTDQITTIALPVGLASSIITIIFAWFQVLLNLSLLTTLYGTQVEGRALT